METACHFKSVCARQRRSYGPRRLPTDYFPLKPGGNDDCGGKVKIRLSTILSEREEDGHGGASFHKGANSERHPHAEANMFQWVNFSIHFHFLPHCSRVGL